MAYDLDKRTSRIAGQTAKTVFNVGVAIVGLLKRAFAFAGAYLLFEKLFFPKK